MADLQHRLARVGEARELGPRFLAVGQRFLDQNVDARLDQTACNLVMERRRHGDARGIDFA